MNQRMTISREQFDALKGRGHTLVPVMCEVLADRDTPLSIYQKLAYGPYSYLFESVLGGEKWGRYSIIGLPCREVIRIYGKQIHRYLDGKEIEVLTVADPLAWIDELHQQYNIPDADDMGVDILPRFAGGLVGYFGYDTIRYIEPKLADCPVPDTLGVPDILLMVSEEVLVVDNLSSNLQLIIYTDPKQPQAYEKACKRIAELIDRLDVPLTTQRKARAVNVSEDDFVSGFTRDGFEQAVEKIKDYIVAGDVMQVVLSQRLSVPYTASALDLYRALRTLNPSPYMFYLDLGDFHVVGSSPEILVRLEDGQVTVRPIAGTRPRGRDEEHDKQLEQELLADPKELAEHLMLIDLGRNDAGRVAKVGTVELTENMAIERYSHVMHIVSNVVAELKPNMRAMDVLRATFPAGTVSGAPKIRAMEIIDELEPVKRGVYAGAVGYLAWNGNMDTAIAIRTAVIKDGTLTIQVGAGIVHDSIPRNEWDETMNKGRAVFRAVAMAEAGLDGAHR